jgi:kinesin family protein 6/9
MSSSASIQIFLRVRPTKKPYPGIVLDEDEGKLDVHVHRREVRDVVNNQREDYAFKFNGMMGMQTKQPQVFTKVAQSCVDSFLDGYNSTIFAYGQTGSGKTYTITGGAERYEDRGLIPRSLSYIFKATKERTDTVFKISISYLEIYNEDGFDLLDENQGTRNLSDLPKVIPREDQNERITLTNLSMHRADAEEDALNLLFIGDTNRVVAETPKHDASTRSHCIFIIQLEAQKVGSDVKTVSRLHLVDLAGSERVDKTGINGILLKEAKSINLSLHYLEQVIVCLQKRSQGEQIHIPYRNSLMTLVLRDSLGGNCRTTMIATVSAEEGDIDESVSTCRFAQRVASIKNEVMRNEQLDPSLIIQRLKQEIVELKAEIRMLKGESALDHLEAEDIEECRQLVAGFVEARDPSVRLVLSDMLKINECFMQFKRMYNQLKGEGPKPAALSAEGKPMDAVSNEEVERLRMLVQQRDNEIAILLGHINKHKSEGLELPTAPSESTATSVVTFPAMQLVQTSIDERPRPSHTPVAAVEPDAGPELSLEELNDRNKAFEAFRKSYRKNEAMAENKTLLKEKITYAKQLAEQINGARDRMNRLVSQIEQLRRENAAQGVVDSSNVPLEHPEEEPLKQNLVREKALYKDWVSQMKEAKSEIDGLRQLIDHSTKRMNQDFEQWLVAAFQKRQRRPLDPRVQQDMEAFYRAKNEINSKFS